MSDGHRSFWSSVPGLITGLAGLLTGIVGMVTLLVQQGIIGNNGKTTATTTVTTTVPGGTISTVAPPTTVPGSFTLNPRSVDFQPATLKQPVTVKNTGPTPVTVSFPTLTGPDSARFSVSMGDCDHALAANLSCSLQVTFTPVSGAALKHYSATLQVTAAGAARGDEVPVTATTLL